MNIVNFMQLRYEMTDEYEGILFPIRINTDSVTKDEAWHTYEQTKYFDLNFTSKPHLIDRRNELWEEAQKARRTWEKYLDLEEEEPLDINGQYRYNTGWLKYWRAQMNEENAMQEWHQISSEITTRECHKKKHQLKELEDSYWNKQRDVIYQYIDMNDFIGKDHQLNQPQKVVQYDKLNDGYTVMTEIDSQEYELQKKDLIKKIAELKEQIEESNENADDCLSNYMDFESYSWKYIDRIKELNANNESDSENSL